MWRNRSDPWFNRNHEGTKTRRLGVLVSWWSTALLCLLALLAMVAGRPPRLAPSANSAFRTPHSALAVTYARLPLSFEANQGQTDESVKFVSRGPGYTLFLTGSEAVLQLRSADPGPAGTGLGLRNEQRAGLRQPAPTPHSALRIPHSPAPSASSAVQLRLRLLGANPTPEMRGLEELPGKSNYFIGNDPAKWRTNVPNYAKVEYRDVYPGINLVHYGNGGQLEHDFVVSPGADPSVIRFAIEGADKMELDAQGDLVLHAAGTEARLRKPVVYEQVDGVRREVAGRYVLPVPGARSGRSHPGLAMAQVGFEVGPYDTAGVLVIDPVLMYSTYWGGSSGEDQGFGIAVDASGAVYVTGGTRSSNFPVVNALQGQSGGWEDVFVSKLNAAGSALVYSTYLGGSVYDYGYVIAVDPSGAAYVTGSASSTNFPVVNALQAAHGGGGTDAFVSKLNATGSALVYSTYLGGSGGDSGYGIAVDASGAAYVTGSTGSSNFPTASALQGVLAGVGDAFVSKLNAAGSALVYSTYLGGSGDEGGSQIAVDALGAAYLTGTTTSTDFPTANPLQATHGGGWYDAFVSKLNAAGSALVYSTYLGGSGGERASGIAVDASGAAYVAGATRSTSYDDVFVSKLNAAGSALIYSTSLGGRYTDGGSAVAVDATGAAYVTGVTESDDFPTASALQTTHGGGVSDAFVIKLNATGSVVYSTYLGGTGSDGGAAVAVDASGAAYVTGRTHSGGLPMGNALQGTVPGWSCAFVAKIVEPGAACTYLLEPTSQGFFSSGASGTVAITTPAGCPWNAASNANWVALTSAASGSGSGTVSYTVAAKTTRGGRTGTLTIAQQTFTVTQAGPGEVTAGAVQGMPGGTARVPVTATIETGLSADRLSFSLYAFANGSAPALSSNLSFQQDSAVPAPTTDTSGGAGSITVTWQDVSPALSGTMKLGEALVPVPAAATGGQSYTVQITAVSASLAGTAVPLLKGANGLLTVTTVNPAPSLTSLSPSNGAQGGTAFTLTVNGTNFVTGSVVRWNGADRTTTFVSSTQLTAAVPASDLTATEVATVTVFNPAPGGGASNGLPFTISVPNPAPTISSLSPASATAGGSAFNLTVNGMGFFTGSVARWNGADLTTAFSSATQLMTVVPAGDIMAAGTAQVTVFNPAPGGGTSNAINFPVNLSATPAAIVKVSGDKQTGAAGTALASALVVQVNSAAGSGIAGVVVSFAVTAGSATLSTQTAVTNSSGQAQVSVTMGTTPGAVGITASVTGVSPAAVFGATSTAREPAALTIVSGANQTAAAGSALADALVVKVTDQYGNPVPGITVSFAVTAGAASLSSATATTASDGKAQVNVTLGTTPGTVTISASVAGVSPAQTFTATATVGPAVPPSIVNGNNQSAAVANALAGPLVVKIADQYGNPLVGVAVSFAITAGSGTLGAPSAVTNSSGQAQVTLTLGTTAGTVTVSATISGVATPAVFTETATPGPPAALTYVSGNNQTGVGGGTLQNPLVVKVTDQYANPIQGITVLFAVVSGAGSLSASSVLTDASGQAQVTWKLGGIGVEHAVHASSGTLPVVTFTATAITGPPATLTIVSGNNQTAVAGTTLPLPLVVRVTDQNGNVVPGVVVTFSVTGGNGSLSAASATTDANGLAQATWTLGTVEGANTAQAQVGTLPAAIFHATGAAAITAVGTVGIAAASGSPGGSARIPVTLSMNGPATVDSVAFGLRVEAVGTAPALTDALSLAKDAAMAEPTFSDTSAGPGTISVGWLSLATALSGTVRLGEVLVPIPALATDGQSYTVRITGASGSLGAVNMTLLAGANATISVAGRSYLVGDAFPLGSDLNSDTDKDDAGEFGDDQLQILDLVYGLRAVTSVPGYRPPACSDRFDAIDSHPADTPTVRGGNATLNTVDLIYTLRRVTNVDTARSRRYSRNLPCTASAGPELVAQASLPVGSGGLAARLELALPQAAEGGAVRIPVYLEAARDLELAGLSWAVDTGGGAVLQFVAGEAKPPTLVDRDVPGVLSIAWLEGLQVAAGQRLLLGYVVAPGLAPGTGTLQFIGISASAPDGSDVRLSAVAPREQM
jgi:hypothetical protein